MMPLNLWYGLATKELEEARKAGEEKSEGKIIVAGKKNNREECGKGEKENGETPQ